jgi:hypothetical protein
MSVEALKKITAGSDKGTEVVAAVKELNAMHGYNAPSKVELSGKLHVDLSDEELDAKIAALSGA